MTRPASSTGVPWSETHGFISFRLDLTKIHPETWALLGEISSKLQHVANVPMKPNTAKDLFRIFLVKGVHGTTAIEGNTLSEEQVRLRLEKKLHLPASQEYLGTEVDNVIKAYVRLIQQITAGAPAHLGPADLKALNKMVLEGLDVADDVVPGEFREHVVGVNDYRSPSPEYTAELVERLCVWMNHDVWDGVIGCPYVLPVLKSIVAHLYLAWIHPFGDGNGRTARLLEFDILTRAGVPPISAHVLSDHYNKTRGAYYRALSNARRDPTEFVRYAVQGFADGLREQVQRIWQQQADITWTNYVHGIFRKRPHTTANHRRRDVAITLGHRRGGPIDWRHIPQLNTELAAAYASSQRMVQRDVNILERLGLVTIQHGGSIVANTSKLQNLLPLRNQTAVERRSNGL